MAEHTPGPWFVERDGIMNATRSYTVCLIGDSDQDRADAELIARAPDLLAAVERVRSYCQDALEIFVREGIKGTPAIGVADVLQMLDPGHIDGPREL